MITHPVIFGSGIVETTLDGAASVTNTQVFPNTAFSIITDQVRTYEVGNEFTLAGDFTTSQPFANFIPGNYSDNVNGLSFNGGFYQTTETIELNISSIPEPSTIVLFGTCFIGLIGHRRKKRDLR